jgi:hypothetical protein
MKPTAAEAQPPRYVTLFVAGALSLVLLAVVLGPRAMAEQPVPALDLRAAGLSRVAPLVTPFEVRSEDGGRMITLIGAYADPALTVVFLRVTPDSGMPNLNVTDEQGSMDSTRYSTVGVGAPGDYVFVLDSGPRVGPDHTAHLTADVTGLSAPPVLAEPPHEFKGRWTFTFALPVQPATALPHQTRFQLGSWMVTIEVLELTPAVVHLQALIDGGGVEEVGMGLDSAVSLLDESGKPVGIVGLGTATPTSKEQLNPTTGPSNSARVNLLWLRPPAAVTYQLLFRRNGETHTIAITIPALA